MRAAIVRQAYEAFRIDVERAPIISLRGGNAIDRYGAPPPYDPEVDTLTDDYLATYTFWGLGYLDAPSWRHYLPHLIAYTFRHITSLNTMAPEGLLASLRPPDREPPRLATLTPEQEASRHWRSAMTRVCTRRMPCRSSMSGGFQTRGIGTVLIRAGNEALQARCASRWAAGERGWQSRS
jgi:hypothetical protein